MNKALFIGNVGKDAEVRQLDNGSTAISFSVAVNEGYKDKSGQQVDKTTWVNCTIWKFKDQSTSIAQYLTKGTKVYVEGTASVRAYTTGGGVAAASLELKVNFVELLGGGERKSAPSGNGYPHQEQPVNNTAQAAVVSPQPDFPDEDLPF